ncbi:MAG: CRISPR-associated endonuclease Cas1 [Phycisphaeraceae bacterium]|nr:CRISPR-associated endonuclease Cas1 [Phycisphaeraceae bacterium]
MIKRTIEISRQPAHLSARLDQLIVQPIDRDKAAAHSIPAEDIGLVMVDQPRSSFSYHALAMLMKHGTALVICGRDHLPLGLMLPLPSHSEVVWRIEEQIAVSQPAKKRLWQQLIRAKILAQAANIPPDLPVQRQLLRLAAEVKSGDSTNVEGQAARLYWSAWLTSSPTSRTSTSRTADHVLSSLESDGFRRDPAAADPLNAMLNYGYGVLRAAVGRALVSSGLFPALGLHHHNRANPFCLADDLMEPLRPLVDARVRQLYLAGHRQLDQPTKAELLNILTDLVHTDGQTGPLMVSLARMTASLASCYRGDTRKLVIPVAAKADGGR